MAEKNYDEMTDEEFSQEAPPEVEEPSTEPVENNVAEPEQQEENNEVEEIPLAESFSTEVHQSEELIEDYVPTEDFETVEEISL